MPADYLGQEAVRKSTRPQARFLSLADMPGLLALEAEKWDVHQAASAKQMAARIETYPHLSIGAFCPDSGQVLASLFMKPAADDFWKHARDWSECAEGATPLRSRTLFGISLSSCNGQAVQALLEFFWPHALAGGWRHIYLGSPVPGWREWRERNPGSGILDYLRETRTGGRPLDPQLRYYHARGFTEVVCLKNNYFPHERSMDHGAILRGTVPLSGLSPLWRHFTLEQIQGVTRRLSRWLL